MSTKDEIFEYVMNTPGNTNPGVLRSLLDGVEGGSGSLTPEEVYILKQAINSNGIGYMTSGGVAEGTNHHATIVEINPATIILHDRERISLKFTLGTAVTPVLSCSPELSRDESYCSYSQDMTEYGSSNYLEINYYPDANTNTIMWHKTGGSGTPAGTEYMKIEEFELHQIDGNLVGR